MPSVIDLFCAVRAWARLWLSHKEEESASTMQPLSPVHKAAQRGDVEELRRLIKRVRHSAPCRQLESMLLVPRVAQPGVQADGDWSLTGNGRLSGLVFP